MHREIVDGALLAIPAPHLVVGHRKGPMLFALGHALEQAARLIGAPGLDVAVEDFGAVLSNEK